jgi:hypothetical protein
MCSSTEEASEPLSGLDGQQLPLVVPLIQRRALVETLIALQPDQPGIMGERKRSCDLGLADAGLALRLSISHNAVARSRSGMYPTAASSVATFS